MTDDLTEQLSGLRSRHIDGALCMIVKTEGSTPLKAGAWMLVGADGSTTGTVGGGPLEHAVIANALQAIADDAPSLMEHRLVRDHNMCCGGTVQLFIKPLLLAHSLYIFGAGHIGSALARLCEHLSFDVTVIDDRPGIFDAWPDRQVRTINAHPREAMPSLAWDERTCVVIATYSHPLDREILRYCLGQPLAYCGMIGSARKVAVTRTLFLEQCWATAAQLDQIDMPIGIDIGAETPEEIAVSIAARLVAVRRRATPLTDHRPAVAAVTHDTVACHPR